MACNSQEFWTPWWWLRLSGRNMLEWLNNNKLINPKLICAFCWFVLFLRYVLTSGKFKQKDFSSITYLHSSKDVQRKTFTLLITCSTAQCIMFLIYPNVANLSDSYYFRLCDTQYIARLCCQSLNVLSCCVQVLLLQVFLYCQIMAFSWCRNMSPSTWTRHCGWLPRPASQGAVPHTDKSLRNVIHSC